MVTKDSDLCTKLYQALMEHWRTLLNPYRGLRAPFFFHAISTTLNRNP